MTRIDKISSIGGDSPLVDAYQAYQNMMNARSQAAEQKASSPVISASLGAGANLSGADARNQAAPSYEEFKQRVDKLNQLLDTHTTRLSFGIEGNVFLLRIIDVDAGKVVKQIPPKEMVEFLNRMEQEIRAGLAQGQ